MIYTKSQGDSYSRVDEKNGVKILCSGSGEHAKEVIDKYFELLLGGEYDLRTAFSRVNELYGKVDFEILATVKSERYTVVLNHGRGCVIEECLDGRVFVVETYPGRAENETTPYFDFQEYPASEYKNIGLASKDMKKTYYKMDLYPNMIEAIVSRDAAKVEELVLRNTDVFDKGIAIIV